MIKEIAEYFDSKLAVYVEKFIPVAKTVFDGKKTFPAEYTGNANYKPINLDNWNGIAYLRLEVNPFANEKTDVPNRACKTELNIIYPLRLVFCIPRSKVKVDDIFAEDGLIGDLIRDITVKNGGPKSAMKANGFVLAPSGWTTDARQVWNEETSGTGTIDMNYRMIYGAINFNASIDIYADCIKSSCEEECYA